MKDIAHKYWAALTGHRRRGAILIVLMAASGLLEALALASIIPLMEASTGATSEGLHARLAEMGLTGRQVTWLALLAFLILGTLSATARFFGEASDIRLRADIERSMRDRMSQLLWNMRWPAFLQLKIGDIGKSAMVEGAETAAGAVVFLRGLGNSAIAIAFMLTAVTVSPGLTVLTIAFGAIASIGYRFVGRYAQLHARAASASAGEIGDQVNSIFGNLKFFRSTGDWTRARHMVSDAYGRYSTAFYRSTFFGVLMRFFYDSAALFFVAAVLAYSIMRDGRLTAPSLVFLALFYRLAPRIQTAQDNFHTAKVQLPWYEEWQRRVAVALSAQEDHAGHQSPTFEHGLSLEDVTFSYEGATEPAVRNVDLEMPAGHYLAVVGESGSGKSTLIDLITGLLAPQSGSVRIDGQPLSDLDIEAWQQRIGLVLQDSPIFHTTILDNIAWTDPEPDLARARECARMAHAEDFIAKLPAGMETIVGERGGRLSGGQRQRLALARALYRDPWLLVLDEATSALDSESEELIQRALRELKGKLTVVVVAHRLATVAIADRIVVMQAGRVIESGTWNELVADGGIFARFAQLQTTGGD